MNTFDNTESKKIAHDSEAAPNLISFMLKNWKPVKRTLNPLKNAKSFAKRRKALSRLFPGEILIIPTGHLKVRANDTHYSFRPGTDFFYLTGNWEPDCILLLIPNPGAGHREILFVEPNPGKTDATFFTDRIKGELWEGARLGVPESQITYGIEECRGLPEFKDFLRELRGYRWLKGQSAIVEALLPPPQMEQIKKNNELSTALSEMRLIKDAEEIGELQKVIDATQLGFEDVIQRLKYANSERELEGVFFTRARMEGNDVGYGSIVASGAHACTLHWKKNDGQIRKGDLLLLDAGIEGHSLYTADITRTLPINGKFSPAQREIYELVLSAQKAAFAEVKPGSDFMAPNVAAMKVIAYGLEKLKILPTSAEVALQSENQFYKRYSLHNVSHMLGMDVHDCAQARAENYKYGKLAPGMVLTVEPGIYFQLDDLTVPPKYRGIGIRVEDDVVVTARGYKNLSQKIPSQVKDVEKWMKTLWRGK